MVAKRLRSMVEEHTAFGIAGYLDLAVLESSTVAHNLQTLAENLSRSQHNNFAEVIQLLETAIANYRQPEIPQQALTAIGEFVEESRIDKALAGTLESVIEQLSTNQATSDQALNAISSYVEQQEVIGSTILQDLETLIKQLLQRQEPRVLVSDQQVDLTTAGSLGQDNQQTAQQLLETITQYIEQEVVELAILPVLEKVVTDLNKLQTRKSLPQILVIPNSDIFEKALSSITSFIEETAVESEVTEVIEDLTEQLTLLQPEISTLGEKLSTAISHVLQQAKAVSAKKQQEISAQAVEALSNYVDHSAVESTLNPQALQTLSKQLSRLSNRKLNAAMRQLEAFVASYQAYLRLSQAAKPIVEAIADYSEQTAIHDAISLDVEQLAQNLSQLGESQLPKQLLRVIEQYRQQMEAQVNPAIQKQIDEPNLEQKPLANQKAHALEQQRLVYRQKYQELQKRVLSYPGFSDSPSWEVDVGVALLVVKESSDPNEVGCVLTQSNQLQEWKALLPDDEYITKGKAYIHQVYEQAWQLREMRSLQRQQERSLGLDL